MLQLTYKDPSFSIIRKITAKIHEEINIIVRKKQRVFYRFILSHKPVRNEMVILYVNGRYLVQGEGRDYNIEDQIIFIRPIFFQKGFNLVLLRYDYFNTI